MQNSPLLVSPVAPVNKANAVSKQQSQQETSEPFQQVLSKQVKKESVSASVEENELKKDDVLDDVELELEMKEAEASIEASVDAQLLAKEATAKTLKDVTEGNVNIDATAVINVAATAEAKVETTVAAKVEALTTEKQTELNIVTGLKKTVAGVDTDADTAKDLKVTETAVNTDADADESADVVNSQLQAKPLKEDGGLLQAKFANALAVESKQQVFVEALAEKNIKIPAEISALSLQNSTVKPVATAEVSQLQAAGASNVISAFPGKTGWNEAINQKVMWMVGASEQSATLTLNPKDLGPLQVIIQVNNEKADATFISENPEVRKALEEGLSSLRNSMGQAGVELGQANVNSQQQQQAFQQANQAAAARSGDSNGEPTVDDGLAATNRVRVSNGLVDTFA